MNVLLPPALHSAVSVSRQNLRLNERIQGYCEEQICITGHQWVERQCLYKQTNLADCPSAHCLHGKWVEMPLSTRGSSEQTTSSNTSHKREYSLSTENIHCSHHFQFDDERGFGVLFPQQKAHLSPSLATQHFHLSPCGISICQLSSIPSPISMTKSWGGKKSLLQKETDFRITKNDHKYRQKAIRCILISLFLTCVKVWETARVEKRDKEIEDLSKNATFAR